jgi:hypothetical protein
MSLTPNFTPQQTFFSVKSGGAKKQKARKISTLRAFATIRSLKPAFAKAAAGNGGGEEIRTPVQTYSPKAFYMLICLLIFVRSPERNKPMISLAGWS